MTRALLGLSTISLVLFACSGAGVGAGGDGDGDGDSSTGTGAQSSVGGSGFGTGGVYGAGASPGAGGGSMGTGSSGSGGSGVVIPDDHPPEPDDLACGAGVVPVGAGRCATSKVTGQGTALTIHNFEDAGEANNHLAAFFADERAGEWWEAHYPDGGATGTLVVAAQTGASPSSQFALHYSGTAPGGWGATAGIAIADCYDGSAYDGISFSIKGNPGAGNSWIKFSLHTPVSEPEPSGGCSAADEAAGKCRDHFAVKVPVTDGWTRHNIKWADFGQQCPSNVADTYNPGSELITLSFSITEVDKGYDFWIDDVSFDVGTEPGSGFGSIISQAAFEELWKTENSEGVVTDLRNPFYTYQGLVAAAAAWSGFSTSGDWTANRREVAAFLANMAHESDSLKLVRETACQDGSCEYGNYYGRGPIQLTWESNYAAAGSALGQNLVGSPDLVATNAEVAFGTALWFWNTSTGAGSQTPHAAIQSGSFAGTIRAINGALECNGQNTAAVQTRIRHYLRICQFLGVDPGTDLDC